MVRTMLFLGTFSDLGHPSIDHSTLVVLAKSKMFLCLRHFEILIRIRWSSMSRITVATRAVVTYFNAISRSCFSRQIALMFWNGRWLKRVPVYSSPETSLLCKKSSRVMQLARTFRTLIPVNHFASTSFLSILSWCSVQVALWGWGGFSNKTSAYLPGVYRSWEQWESMRIGLRKRRVI